MYLIYIQVIKSIHLSDFTQSKIKQKIMMEQKVNISEKFSLFEEHWTPKIIAQFNDNFIKIAKLKGEFVWHDHANEDELFIVIKGKLTIEFRDKIVHLSEGECFVVPKGVEHNPIAEEECHIMLIEPKTIKHTGNVNHPLTKDKLDWI